MLAVTPYPTDNKQIFTIEKALFVSASLQLW